LDLQTTQKTKWENKSVNPVLLRDGETCRAGRDTKQSSTTAALPPELQKFAVTTEEDP